MATEEAAEMKTTPSSPAEKEINILIDEIKASEVTGQDQVYSFLQSRGFEPVKREERTYFNVVLGRRYEEKKGLEDPRLKRGTLEVELRETSLWDSQRAVQVWFYSAEHNYARNEFFTITQQREAAA